MKNEDRHKEYPALGCKVGQAYYVMLSQLDDALNEAALEITSSEYLVLRALYSTDGLQQCDIAALVGKDKASVSRCVSAMEKHGLVTTQVVSHKCRRVFLTPEGTALKHAVMEVAESRHKALLSLASPEEIAIFTDIIEKIISTK